MSQKISIAGEILRTYTHKTKTIQVFTLSDTDK